jgi:hypothetical protein
LRPSTRDASVHRRSSEEPLVEAASPISSRTSSGVTTSTSSRVAGERRRSRVVVGPGDTGDQAGSARFREVMAPLGLGTSCVRWCRAASAGACCLHRAARRSVRRRRDLLVRRIAPLSPTAFAGAWRWRRYAAATWHHPMAPV